METSQTIKIPEHWRRTFFTVWVGQAFSLFGSSLVQFALVWWITQRTGSATLLATATLLAMLPQIILGPFAGALVDRWNRRLVMIISDSTTAISSLVLGGLFLAGRVEVWHVFLILIIRSIGGTFQWPAMQASTTLMVPDDQLARIAGLNQMLGGLMAIIAPPAGALALALLPIGGVIMIDVVTAAIAVGTLIVVQIPQPATEAPAGGTIRTMLNDMQGGLRYIARWPGMLALGGVAMLINFFLTPAFSLLPLLVTKYFKGDALLLGEMNSAYGVGVVLGGLLLGAWGGFRKKIFTSIAGLMLMGVGVIVLGAVPTWLVVVGIVGSGIAGFANPIANGPLQAIFQSSIAPEMQGRVFGLISTIAALISPFSLLVAGPICDWLGIQVWYWVAGIASIIMGFIMLLIPTILNIEAQGQALRQSQPAQ